MQRCSQCILQQTGPNKLLGTFGVIPYMILNFIGPRLSDFLLPEISNLQKLMA